MHHCVQCMCIAKCSLVQMKIMTKIQLKIYTVCKFFTSIIHLFVWNYWVNKIGVRLNSIVVPSYISTQCPNISFGPKETHLPVSKPTLVVVVIVLAVVSSFYFHRFRFESLEVSMQSGTHRMPLMFIYEDNIIYIEDVFLKSLWILLYTWRKVTNRAMVFVEAIVELYFIYLCLNIIWE